MSEGRICKYGQNLDGCAYGFPGCLCADQQMLEELRCGVVATSIPRNLARFPMTDREPSGPEAAPTEALEQIRRLALDLQSWSVQGGITPEECRSVAEGLAKYWHVLRAALEAATPGGGHDVLAALVKAVEWRESGGGPGASLALDQALNDAKKVLRYDAAVRAGAPTPTGERRIGEADLLIALENLMAMTRTESIWLRGEPVTYTAIATWAKAFDPRPRPQQGEPE